MNEASRRPTPTLFSIVANAEPKAEDVGRPGGDVQDRSDVLLKTLTLQPTTDPPVSKLPGERELSTGFVRELRRQDKLLTRAVAVFGP